MSIIVGILEKDYVLLCSDTQINYSDGTVGEIDKTIFVNENIILSVGGNSQTAFGTCSKIFSLYNDLSKVSFDQFDNDISKEISNLLYSENNVPDTTFIIGGRASNELYMRLLRVSGKEIIQNELLHYDSFPHRRLCSSDATLHIDAIKQYLAKDNIIIDDAIDGFQKVVDIGIAVDKTINNKIEYAYLRK